MNSVMILTNCTSRKRGKACPVTLKDVRTSDSLALLVKRWRTVLQATPSYGVVGDLYVGRTFADARRAAKHASGEVFVVSAGLGLAHQDDEAPRYDLTFADSTNPLAIAMTSNRFNASDWWQALSVAGVGRGLISKYLATNDPDLVLIALPAGYLEMISEDLSAIPVHLMDRVRIFSSKAGLARLPNALKKLGLPYDERLESLKGYSGTRSDFAQRALLHFVTELDGTHSSIEKAKEDVTLALHGLSLRTIPTRLRLDDSEIAKILRKNWARHDGSSSRLLTFLRHDAQIACEQKRFRDIWRIIKSEKAKKGT